MDKVLLSLNDSVAPHSVRPGGGRGELETSVPKLSGDLPTSSEEEAQHCSQDPVIAFPAPGPQLEGRLSSTELDG